METQPIIAIKNLHKSFGQNNILKGINLRLNKGENLVILGRSGSGKSVTIKCIVGLVNADKGSIKISGKEVTNLKYDELNDLRVKIGFMFQNGALYDSMSIRQNLKFTLKHHTRDLSEEAIEPEIIKALESVGLQESIDKMPAELSGGMQKRIALARALIIKPEIILYDEPTSGLDTITSREISELILDVQKKYKTSSLIITHDMACAKITGNRILILKEGEIIAEGTYEELEKSKDEWVRSFFI
ncbi:ABC transporter ATP-binding protein [Flavobacterium aquicola]|uniref:Phospholipid/cholesterol/gamma-HCH transport system ATP-binding protein n=1 Tax=Flavobacterium aquicola TaxID=1682742 RepID=A0A3E0ERT6_9FLAO|nr:ATP-binding cassette domain-containing protein [Flavobacterium aquicola]REH00504.1 phospholipid/cholesterol/gamma-HCH transport system ATP-binding protein [Flavobacterium aquicola]